MVKSKKNRKPKVIPKTRKELRKDKRIVKKQNKQTFFSNKKFTPGTLAKNSEESKKNLTENKKCNDEIESDFDLSDNETNTKISQLAKKVAQPQKKKIKNVKSETDHILESRKREKQKQKELERKMHKHRINQLKEANEEEDIVIRKMEKKLNINKHRNEKSVHKMFNDGLDYALELCLPDNIKKMYSAAKEAADLSNDEDDFQEDLAMALGKNNTKIPEKKMTKKEKIEHDEKRNKIIATKNQKNLKKIENKYLGTLDSDFSGSDSELDDERNDEDSKNENEDETSDLEENSDFDILEGDEELDDSENEQNSENENDGFEDLTDDLDLEFVKTNNKNLMKVNGKKTLEDTIENDESQDESINNNSEDDKKAWEDIYGRKRDADGNVIEPNAQKYVPPHIKARIEVESGNDPKRKEKLERLRKLCKGFLNRLSESNMHKISTDIENLYMKNSRFDMNNTLNQLILDALVSNVLSKERMILEHTMLIAILHTNVGSEVGSHFLQSLINKFAKLVNSIDVLDVENKELDNLVLILSHLYTFKIFQHSLLFEIIKKIVEKLCEKSIECLLLILKSIGFQLRKDDPAALKDLILAIQKKANDSNFDIKENPRFKFMLEILNAIKNNNMNKIPQFDPELAEHLKKILKSMFSNGKYLSTLNITMEDLLKADEKGKWWVVGSAWTGNIKDIGAAKSVNQINKQGEKFSEKLLNLAKEQRMNTNDRRNVFCILMSAEDYIEAFERLLHLALKDQRIITSIIIHCCLSEKQFNPYYAVLAQKFSDYDRKYKLAIQFATWDKIKEIQSLNKLQIKNLAQFLIYLIVQGGQPISILKVIEFAELDKVTLRLVRQIFLGILLGKENECQQIFERIAPSIKLNNFKDSIKLFMHHFLLKGSNQNEIPSEQIELLKNRISMADRTLSYADSKLRF